MPHFHRPARNDAEIAATAATDEATIHAANLRAELTAAAKLGKSPPLSPYDEIAGLVWKPPPPPLAGEPDHAAELVVNRYVPMDYYFQGRWTAAQVESRRAWLLRVTGQFYHPPSSVEKPPINVKTTANLWRDRHTDSLFLFWNDANRRNACGHCRARSSPFKDTRRRSRAIRTL